MMNPRGLLTIVSPSSSAGGPSGATAVAPHRPSGRGRQGPRNALDLLTPADRALIRACTGETIHHGQNPSATATSAFAMQIADDRRNGRLAEGQEVTRAYLQRTADDLDQLGIPAHPFQGPAFERALIELQSRSGGRVDLLL